MTDLTDAQLKECELLLHYLYQTPVSTLLPTLLFAMEGLSVSSLTIPSPAKEALEGDEGAKTAKALFNLAFISSKALCEITAVDVDAVDFGVTVKFSATDDEKTFYSKISVLIAIGDDRFVVPCIGLTSGEEVFFPRKVRISALRGMVLYLRHAMP